MRKFKIVLALLSMSLFCVVSSAEMGGKQPIIAEGLPKTLTVNYQTHVQNVGWQTPVKDGEMAGTTGKGLRIEAFRMNLANLPVSGGIEYAGYIQNIGWKAPATDNQISGTTGEGLRMEAFSMSLTGELAKYYDVYYRTHIQNYGWLEWAKNGENAGSRERSLRMEAIEVKLIKKEMPAPAKNDGLAYLDFGVMACYSPHVQNLGWKGIFYDGEVAGTTGKGLRIEALTISLTNAYSYYQNSGIEYTAHVQDIGWQSPIFGGEVSGTVGKGLRMEAVRIKLTGGIAKYYDVYYRTHIENYGWLGWAKNGQNAGSEGKELRMEAIEMKIVVKGEPAPETGSAYVLANGQKV